MSITNTQPGTIAVVVIGDGRPYLDACVESLLANVRGNITEWWMYDDTGDPAHRLDLARRFSADDRGLLEALDLRITDHKYQHRVADDDTVPLALAESVRDRLRTIVLRQHDGTRDPQPHEVDEAIARWFTVRQATPRWVSDGDPTAVQLPPAPPVDWRHINAGPRQGFAGAIQHVWGRLLAASNAEWVFHVEQDFVFPHRIELDAMADVLASNRHLAQMALCRQPWSAAEHAAGGVVETNRTAYMQIGDPKGRQWLEHRLFWTTNPSLYRLDMCAVPWPSGARSEGRFTHHLLQAGAPGITAARLKFGYWGEYHADGRHVLVEHIGKERAGHGY